MDQDVTILKDVNVGNTDAQLVQLVQWFKKFRWFRWILGIGVEGLCRGAAAGAEIYSSHGSQLVYRP